MPNATFRFGPLSEHECRIVCGYFGSERYFVDGALVQKHWSLSPNGSREFRAVDHLIRIDVSIKFKRVDAAAFVDGQLVASDLFADINERFKRQRRHINIVTALMIGLAIFLTAFAG